MEQNKISEAIGTIIEPKSKVLEISCETGALGDYLQECTIYGVERDLENTKVCEKNKNYVSVLTGDVETPSFMKKVIEQAKLVDVIVLGNILECLNDPTTFLKTIIECDKPVIVNFKNVSHVDTVCKILDDEWTVGPTGTSDLKRTNFFTKTSFLKWLDRINQDTKKYQIDCKMLDRTFEFPKNDNKKYKPLLRLLEEKHDLHVSEYIVELQKSKTTPNLKKLIEKNKKEQVKLTDIMNQLVVSSEKYHRDILKIVRELQSIYHSKGYRLLNVIYKLKSGGKDRQKLKEIDKFEENLKEEDV